MRALVAAVGVLTFVLAACGSRAPLSDAAGDLAPAEALAARGVVVPTTVVTVPTTPPTTPPAAGGAATAAPTTRPAPQPTAPKPPLNIKITFAVACVVPGTAQTMLIDLGEPGAMLYWVEYAKNHIGPYQAMHAPSGKFQGQWVVPPTTPPGPAEAHVTASSYSGRRGEAVGTFGVADVNGHC